MRRRKAYYRVWALSDGTIVSAIQDREPRKSRYMPKPESDPDGVLVEYPQKVYSHKDREGWVTGMYHTIVSTRLNIHRSLREMVLPNLSKIETQLSRISKRLDRIERLARNGRASTQ